jgi:hypothetical protein
MTATILRELERTDGKTRPVRTSDAADLMIPAVKCHD